MSILLSLLKITAVLLCLVILIAAILLVMPIKYDVCIAERKSVRIRIELSYFFNALSYKYIYNGKHNNIIKLFGKKVNGRKKKKKPLKKTSGISLENKPDKEAQRSKGIDLTKQENPQQKSQKPLEAEEDSFAAEGKFLDVIDNIELIKKIISLMLNINRSFKHNKFNVYIKFGFDNPYHTGIALGALQAVLAVASLPAAVDLEADFNNPVFDFNVDLRGQTRLFLIGVQLIRIASDESVWNIIKGEQRKTKAD